jgi:V/A-type H+-transporting ATPase subunit E
VAGVQAIIDRIVADAKQQADSIQETARHQIAENERKTDDRIKAQKEEIMAAAERECEEEERRFRAIADLEARKNALKKKREAIGEAFSRAKKKILALQGEAYAEFLFTLLKQSGAEGGEIRPASKDRRFFTDAFMGRAKKEISSDLALGGDFDSLATGFVLISGEAQINCSVDFVLKQAREEMEGDVARILFGGGD